MDESAPSKAWQVLVWGSPLAAGDWGLASATAGWGYEPYLFASKEAAEACAAQKITEGWDANCVEVVEVPAPPPPPPPPPAPEIRIGPRGGLYTEDITKDGRPYRRYF